MNACVAVHMHYVMDTCDPMRSIIILPCMVETSFVLVSQTRLNVSEPKYWVTWSHKTGVNFPVFRGEESNTLVFLFWKLKKFCLLWKYFLTKLKDFCLKNFFLIKPVLWQESGSYCGLMDSKSNILVLNLICF